MDNKVQKIRLQNRNGSEGMCYAFIRVSEISDFYSNRPNNGECVLFMSNGRKYYTDENAIDIFDLCNDTISNETYQLISDISDNIKNIAVST